MNFSYETQGAVTYLVCELSPADQIDTITLGMITANHILGCAQVIYTEMNGMRYLKYNVSAKISCDRFFGGSMNKQRTLSAFGNILNALCSADEYMIDMNCFELTEEHVFLNVSSCEAALICIPTVRDNDVKADAVVLFKSIMSKTQFDGSEDRDYVEKLNDYLNNEQGFSVYGLKELVDKLSAVHAAAPKPLQTQAKMGSMPSTPIAPMSAFDGTISIDDMSPQQSVPIQPCPVTQQPISRPVGVATPEAPAREQRISQGAAYQKNRAPQIQQNTPVRNAPPIPPSQPQRPINTTDSRKNGDPGFAIPGQEHKYTPHKSTVQDQGVPGKEQMQNGEKKLSFFGLLAHYNKENAELYKRQKEEKKQEQERKNAEAREKLRRANEQRLAELSANNRGPVQNSMGSQQPPSSPVNGGVGGAQQRTPVQSMPIQPKSSYSAVPQGYTPVQNSFNETTVLSPTMTGGETTVLNAESAAPVPYITRIKTGERISINKPVFRIGKEKSFVDYFIADNTAISRSHANIHIENGEYFVVDMNSTNHTYVNGTQLTGNVKTKIKSGDKLKLANEDFIFSL